MSGRVTNCGDCAYAEKNNGAMWCTFHDEPVSAKLVCDYFLDEYDSPQWVSLADGMSEKGPAFQPAKQYTAKDIAVYVCSGIILLCSIVILFT